MEIKNPWIIMHQPDGPGGNMQCILAGPPDAGHGQFAIAIADLIRHVARAKEVDEADVLAVVQREIDSPTSEIHRVGPN